VEGALHFWEGFWKLEYLDYIWKGGGDYIMMGEEFMGEREMHDEDNFKDNKPDGLEFQYS
jgi:hypothetical protein